MDFSEWFALVSCCKPPSAIRPPMSPSPNPRQSALLAQVRRHGSASVEALATRFGVALQTVRRDIRRLSDAGLLARFHGGVRLPESATENLAYRQRQALHAGAKQQIARAIARDVPPGSSLFLDIGTTTEAVAVALLQHRGLRVITNHLNVAAILSANADCEVIVAGGIVRHRDRGIVGEAAVDFMRQFKVDIGLIGIGAIEADCSLRDFDYREARVARVVLEQSRQAWLAADQSKFGGAALVELARLDEITRLYTDAEPPAPYRHLLDQAGVECRVAPHARPGRPRP